MALRGWCGSACAFLSPSLRGSPSKRRFLRLERSSPLSSLRNVLVHPVHGRVPSFSPFTRFIPPLAPLIPFPVHLVSFLCPQRAMRTTTHRRPIHKVTTRRMVSNRLFRIISRNFIGASWNARRDTRRSENCSRRMRRNWNRGGT